MKSKDLRYGYRVSGFTIGRFVTRNIDNSNKLLAGYVKRHTNTGIYIGPSVEGGDKEYVKVISGKVDNKRPSFA